MVRTGVTFGTAVALGVAATSTVAPLSPGVSAGAVGLGMAACLRSARAWPLVPAGLGALRAACHRERDSARRIERPMLFSGRVEILSRQGDGLVVAAGGRRVLVSEARALPGPGHSGRLTLRLDPIVSRADPSAFRAGPWARARGLHGRGRVLGPVDAVRPSRPVLGPLRRSAAAIRRHARDRLGFGQGASGDLLTALLLGDRRGLDTADKDAFRRAGLAHVLALSGMHVAILALGLASLLRTLRLGRRVAAVPTLAFLGAFAFLTGAAAPILRACSTAALALGAALAGRRSSGLHALGLVGGAILLVQPFVWRDVGFRLSFLAAAILGLAATAPLPAASAGRLATAARALAEAVLVSAVVTMGTLPVLVESFGRVSLLSPVTNLLAALPAAASLGWSGLAVLTPEPLAGALAGAARHAATALLAVAAVAARIPGGDVVLSPLTPPATLLLVGAAGHLAARRRPSPFALRAGAGLLVAAGAGLVPRDRLTVLDVGQGDAILIESRVGAVLVDGGPPSREPSASFAARAVRRRVSALAAAVVTHGHADHAGGVAEVVGRLPVRSLVVPPRTSEPPATLARLHLVAEAHGCPVQTAAGASTVSELLGGRVVTRSVWSGAPPRTVPENDLSLVTCWRAGAVAAVLPGDLGPDGERELLRAPGDLRAPVLLAAHHGSRDSTSELLLARVSAALVLVSCGRGNPHGHPHPELLARLRDRHCALLRSDRDGSIALTATARGFRIRWTRAFPGPDALFPTFPLSKKPGFS